MELLEEPSNFQQRGRWPSLQMHAPSIQSADLPARLVAWFVIKSTKPALWSQILAFCDWLQLFYVTCCDTSLRWCWNLLQRPVSFLIVGYHTWWWGSCSSFVCVCSTQVKTSPSICFISVLTCADPVSFTGNVKYAVRVLVGQPDWKEKKSQTKA